MADQHRIGNVIDNLAPEGDGLGPAHDALNKMRRAHQRGTGCRLTAEQIHSLSVTRIGELWADKDPRKSQSDTMGGKA